jgi:hypothetical protein
MRCTISQAYFDKQLYMFRTDLLSIIRSLNTVYKTVVIFHACYVDSLLAKSGRTDIITSKTNTYCCVYSVETTDDGQ